MKNASVKIEGVAFSKRLTESSVVLVASQFERFAKQERIMKAQGVQSRHQAGIMAGRKTLEMNPGHRVAIGFVAKVKPDKVDVAAMDTAIVEAELSEECEDKVLEEKVGMLSRRNSESAYEARHQVHDSSPKDG